MNRVPTGRSLCLVACLLAGAVIAALLAGGGSRTSLTPALPPSAQLALGANVNRLFNQRRYPAAQIDGLLQMLRATGATLARSDALWEFTEPSPPTGGRHGYEWGFDDTVAGSLARAGLRWLPILDYSPSWARTDPALLHSPPRDPDAFAAWARALARRYGPGGAFWRAHPALPSLPVDTYEVWNEPDNGEFWQPMPDASAYGRLYAATRRAIDSIQPDARVIVGGLTRPARFMPTLLQAAPGLRGHLDGVAIHPYGPTPAAVVAKVRSARATLQTLGLGTVPLYVTELGWTTSPPGALDYLPARLRPGYLRRSVTQLADSDCGISAILMYTWVTPERDRGSSGDWYGLQPPSGAVPSPDAAALHAAFAHAPYAQRSATARLRTQCSSAIAR